ncbi:MAG: hydrogenase nickel incorporation protein HypB [Planctomycetes bacterium]|nr:hydrogenase nickel incorporation protein HypB [Planctomycetota bacterium]
MSATRIKVYRDLMGENEKWAQATRDFLAERNLLMLNIIGSPGCGKTKLLETVATRFGGKLRFAVLEGDVETTRDAERLAAADIPVSQLLTDGACHLEAKLVNHALIDLPLDGSDVVFVENVGNLVCPAEFDIGEAAKIAVLSVTEGEDKPLKYPLLFRESSLVIISKVDLLPHLDFDVDACVRNVQQINHDAPIIKLSAVTGEDVDEFVGWVVDKK